MISLTITPKNKLGNAATITLDSLEEAKRQITKHVRERGGKIIRDPHMAKNEIVIYSGRGWDDLFDVFYMFACSRFGKARVRRLYSDGFLSHVVLKTDDPVKDRLYLLHEWKFFDAARTVYDRKTRFKNDAWLRTGDDKWDMRDFNFAENCISVSI